MHVLVYSSKNQENSKTTNINVYLLNAKSSKYVTEWTNQEKELRSKTTNAAAGEVMLTVETSRGGDPLPRWLLNFIPLHRNSTSAPQSAAAAD